MMTKKINLYDWTAGEAAVVGFDAAGAPSLNGTFSVDTLYGSYVVGAGIFIGNGGSRVFHMPEMLPQAPGPRGLP